MARITLAFLMLALSGCASHPTSIQPAYVSPVKYADYDCQQIEAERNHIGHRITELHRQLEWENRKDSAQMTTGLLLFWPALFFLEGGDGPAATEYAALNGEFQALSQSAAQKRCGTLTGPELCALYSSTKDRDDCLRDGDWQEPETSDSPRSIRLIGTPR